MTLAEFPRIARDPDVMGGKACIRGTRVTVATVLGNLGAGIGVEELLVAYPYITRGDVLEAIRYGAWLAQEREVSLVAAE
jgi:uncharacterized protein (DUF433 family)